jgi:hypothetical protein
MRTNSKTLVFAVDFDGTVVTNAYPNIGRPIGAAPVLRQLVKNGHRLILYTVRTGLPLQEAIDWYRDNGIELYGVNHNPGQLTWAPDAKKIFFDLCLDDRNYGTPLTDVGTQKVFDWVRFVEDSYGKSWLDNLSLPEKTDLRRLVYDEQRTYTNTNTGEGS